MKSEIATFAEGCFWGVEVTFRNTPGVQDAAAGYMGGTLENPKYQDVCTDTTGHAEVVQVRFDTDEVSYDELLDVLQSSHDPTQLNRQGPDVGSQYRSAIFYHTPAQRDAAIASKERIERSGKFQRRIVTEIIPAREFWRAEEYHQQYLQKRGMVSCHI